MPDVPKYRIRTNKSGFNGVWRWTVVDQICDRAQCMQGRALRPDYGMGTLDDIGHITYSALCNVRGGLGYARTRRKRDNDDNTD